MMHVAEIRSAHFARAIVLKELVWMHMRTMISYVSRYEDHFRAVMEQKLRLSSEAAIRGHKKRLAQAEKRLGELDRLFIRIYEDNVAGRITDEKFSMMSKTYEDEQAQLKVEIQTLQQEIEVQERQIENLEQFIQRVRKYEDLDELTPMRCGSLSRRSTLKPRISPAASGIRASAFPMTLWALSPWKNC